ncbi:BlaI/MecI/CopY family transcriptional regulator [Streptomyces sp. 110]|uniref:BlaI/MecI/CopY family transcriptional regulator n=1 Tax=Streptomyces endocoffeicus TaxID=2898945 RepID=A0ABS1PFY5_9ACTN|nr:BlaI/MecI/CopY family transcriptional regulator [Streptomyces endocoffeicus]
MTRSIYINVEARTRGPWAAGYDEAPVRGGRHATGRRRGVKDREHGRRRGQGELEVQVLAALREAPEPVSTGWVRERLGGTLAHTTVITILTRLLAKGAVTREKEGRTFVWTATADEAGLAALRMRRVLDGESDREAVLASFVTGLPPQDERMLRGLLERAGEAEE